MASPIGMDVDTSSTHRRLLPSCINYVLLACHFQVQVTPNPSPVSPTSPVSTEVVRSVKYPVYLIPSVPCLNTIKNQAYGITFIYAFSRFDSSFCYLSALFYSSLATFIAYFVILLLGYRGELYSSGRGKGKWWSNEAGALLWLWRPLSFSREKVQAVMFR